MTVSEYRLNKWKVPEENSLQHWSSVEDQVSEQIREFYSDRDCGPRKRAHDDRRGPLRPPRPYSVYTLRCSDYTTDQKFKTEAREWMDYYASWDGNEDWDWDGEIPSWAWAAHYADSRVYVGYTNNPYRRISEHIDTEKSALFTTIFPPELVLDIEWYVDEDDARERETGKANWLSDAYPNSFVYQS